jgi:hypothetical protein
MGVIAVILADEARSGIADVKNATQEFHEGRLAERAAPRLVFMHLGSQILLTSF